MLFLHASRKMSIRKIGFYAAISLVMANMVGTGVFVSLGYQLLNFQQGFTFLAIWILGGVVALCGAFSYSELATRLPDSGGEYYFLSKIYHPALGFMAGLVSATVGFAAPIAAASAALGRYSSSTFSLTNPNAGTIIGLCVILGIGALHFINYSAGVGFQKVFTFIKVGLIAIFIVAGFAHGNTTGVSFSPGSLSYAEIFTGGFATNFVFVLYAYSGWNASVYIAGEIKNPERNLNRSLLYGTIIVTILYVLINVVFLMVAPGKEMMVDTSGPSAFAPKEVGIIAGNYIFGNTVGKFIGLMISILLVSTISSMIIAGPRVVQPMFDQFKATEKLAQTSKKGNPIWAIVFQVVLSAIILLTAKFDQIIQYIGFTLTLFSILTVFGVFVYRYKHGKPEGYKAFLYPLTPLLFLIPTVWVCVYQFKDKTTESLLGLGTAAVGGLLYFVSKEYFNAKKQGNSNNNQLLDA